MECLTVLWLFLSFIAVPSASGEVFYVHPNDDSLCPGNMSCYSLHEYASGIGDNSVYKFLNGTHELNTSVIVLSKINVTFQGVENMTEGPHINVMESPVVIQCVGDEAAIIFGNCSNVMLSHLTLKNCGKNGTTLSSNSGEFDQQLHSNYSAIIIYDSFNVTLNYMSLQESPWGALRMIDVIDIRLHYTSFYKNGNFLHFYSQSFAILYYYPPSDANNSFVELSHCNLTYDHQHYGIITIVLFPSSEDTMVNITMTYIHLTFAHYGVYIFSNTSSYKLHIDKLVSIDCGTSFYLQQKSNSNKNKPVISITDSVFSQSFSHAILVFWYGSVVGEFCFNSNILQNNSGRLGSALQIATDQLRTETLITLLHNVTFDGNRIIDNAIKQPPAVTVLMLNMKNLTISNCTFSNNSGSGLGLVNAIVTFNGHNYFVNNTAYSGGGINFISTSYIFLSPDANLSFVNNHANTTGGAINIQQPGIYFEQDKSVTSCFFQFTDDIDVSAVIFYFESNTADVSGDAVYGGAIESCLLANNLQFGRNVFVSVSRFFNQSGDSVLSSDPLNVCFCNETIPNCDQQALTLTAFSGSTIDLTMAVVGQFNNTTTGTIRVSSHSSDDRNYNVRTSNCINLNYKVEISSINQTSITLNATVHNSINIEEIPRKITVNISTCPNGFCLSENMPICNCEYAMASVGTIQSCNASNNSITKTSGSLWLNGTDVCTMSYSSCPFDYCINDTIMIPFNLSNPNEQCAHNRGGTSCGMCSNEMSLMLGSNKCANCTNTNVALMIPFGLLGIILVVLIIALNLTVTVGTINGLLFFANVIKIYQPLVTNFDKIPVLSQFISWINMDFGIETCFYDGMGSCGKTGLQFVFPVYLFMLFLIIIALSRWFSKFARLIGSNSVPVLCTLLLLSFTKLLRTVLLICSYTHLHVYKCNEVESATCNDSSETLWFIDGNYKYFEDCHLPLFIIALLALVFIFVPYVSFLLFFPLWELCRSKWNKGTNLYLKLKPFFDAYAGPHTELFRFWPGILVVIRIVLALTVSIDQDKTILLSLLIAVVAILITVLSFGVVYKESKLHILDIFYLMSLLIISIYVSDGKDQGIIAVLALSFLVFLGIVIYHVYNIQKLRTFFMKEANKLKLCHESNDTIENGINTDQARVRHSTTSELKWSDLREPVLEMQQS